MVFYEGFPEFSFDEKNWLFLEKGASDFLLMFECANKLSFCCFKSLSGEDARDVGHCS
jgi:hypothetical protein